MTYPSTISTFTNPLSSDRLNNPAHSAIETAQNTGLKQVQTFLGVEGPSSTLGTLIYDVRSPGSDGGGHVQTAVKGGTGQTTFTKGDILIAQSASVLAKLAVGLDTQILAANSSVGAGVNWVNPTNNRVISSASVIGVTAGVETSVANGTVVGSTLGTANALRATVMVNRWNTRNGSSVLVRGVYGGGTVASVMFNSPADMSAALPISGNIVFTLIANNNVALQRGVLQVNLAQTKQVPDTIPSVMINLYNANTSSINSSANQPFGITVNMSNGNDAFTTDGSIIEKII